MYIILRQETRPWKVRRWGPVAAAHLSAWQAFNPAVGSSGDVGIWREAYLVKAGGYENIYNNMPRHGLGQAGELKPASGARQAARARTAAQQA